MKTKILAIVLIAAIHANAQQFVRGNVYDADGKKFTGFIALAPPRADLKLGIVSSNESNHFILFKRDSLLTPIAIDGYKMKAFTMSQDSFAVLKNFKIQGYNKPRKLPIGFGRVIVDKGKILLYSNVFNETAVVEYYGINNSITSPNAVQSYLLKPKDGETITFVPMDIEEFMKKMSSYFSDSPEIVQRIKAREYSFFKTEKLVRDYNEWYDTWRMPN